MALSVACAKGCGEALTVTTEMLEEAQRLGVPIAVSHDVCPRDRTHRPQYTVVLTAYRQDYDQATGEPSGERIKIGERGVEVHAGSFKEAHPKLSEHLTDEWLGMLQWSEVMDQDGPDVRV